MPRRAAPTQRVDGLLELGRRIGRKLQHPDVAGHRIRHPRRDVRTRQLLAHEIHYVRIGGIATDDEERHLCSGRTAQQACARIGGHVARRPVVDGADEVPGPDAGLCGRRAVTGGDDAQVIPPRDVESDFRGAARIVGFPAPDELGRQVRAFRIQAIGQPLHRAFHGLGNVHRFNVIGEDEGDDIFEYPQVPVRAVLGHRLAEVAPDERESVEVPGALRLVPSPFLVPGSRSPCPKHKHPEARGTTHEAPAAAVHQRGFSHSTGSTERPSMRISR